MLKGNPSSGREQRSWALRKVVHFFCRTLSPPVSPCNTNNVLLVWSLSTCRQQREQELLDVWTELCWLFPDHSDCGWPDLCCWRKLKSDRQHPQCVLNLFLKCFLFITKLFKHMKHMVCFHLVCNFNLFPHFYELNIFSQNLLLPNCFYVMLPITCVSFILLLCEYF